MIMFIRNKCTNTKIVVKKRPKPGPGAPTQARERFEAREPAWRLLHSVTLLKLHQARNRVHMA